MQQRHVVSVCAVLGLALGLGFACSADRKDVGPTPPVSMPSDGVDEPMPPTRIFASRDIGLAPPSEGSGLVIKLDHGKAEPVEETTAEAPKAEAELRPLDEDEMAPLFARLAPIETQASDRVDFALRKSTRKRPQPGKQTVGVFPPKVTRPKPPTPKVEALRIERVQPTGDVPIAPHLSVTFSQPMVPVTTVDQVLSGPLPVELSPKVTGQWRWAGARTLLFEPKPRFPMASKFTITIPAGAASTLGARLDEPAKYQFLTPPPVVQSFSPSGTVGRMPMMFAAFDQRVVPAAVLAKVRLRAGSKNVGLRLASDKEVEKAGYTALQNEKRAVFFYPKTKLGVDTRVQVTFAKGLPSAEGPRVTTKARSFKFRTYGPFSYRRHRCGWGSKCTPGMALSIEFTNPIGKLDPKIVSITPPIEDARIQNYGNSIQISGKTVGRTKYRVRVPRSLADTYGQKLTRAVDVTFSIGPAQPNLSVPGPEMTVLERTKKPSLSAYTTNHDSLKVKITKVGPEDWYKFLEYKRRHREVGAPPMPGRVVSNTIVKVDAKPDRLVETKIDLSPALTDSRGHLVITVLPGKWRPDPKRRWHWPGSMKWVQVTNIGIDAMVDSSDLYAFATRLSDGAPMDAVDLTMSPANVQAASSKDGVAVMALPLKSPGRSGMLIARKGPDLAFLPESHWSQNSSSWTKRGHSSSYRYFVFDDRGLYRPKEKVRIKGFIRQITNGKTGDVVGLGGAAQKIAFDARDARNNEFAKGESKLSKLGAFSFQFDVPDDINLGRAYVRMRAPGLGSKSGVSGSHSFRVEEFRRPEFEVSVAATEGPHLVGQYGVFTATAKYYTGGALIGADTVWRVSRSNGTYVPPGRSDFVFGEWSPWWWGRHHRGPSHIGKPTETFTAKTAADGTHHLRVDLLSIDPPRATVVSAQAAVSDVNRQTWTGASSFLVHPSASYVGLKTRRSFVSAGQDIEVDVINVGLDGQAKAGEFSVELSLPGNDKVKKQTCRPKEPEAVCTFTPKKGGRYHIVARTKDDRGRANRSSMYVWVSGGENVPTSRNVEEEKAQLIPNQETFAAGEVAELLVQSPFPDAHGVYTVGRDGVLKHGTFETDGSSAVLKIPIKEKWTPNVHVNVWLTGRQKRRNNEGKVDPELPPRPAFAAAQITLSIPPRSRTLAVSVRPEARETEPGSDTSVRVDVKSPSGEPAGGAEVTLYVVDEAVLALASYQTPDPLAVFYTTRGSDLRVLRNRQHVFLADPDEVAQTAFNAEESDDAEKSKEAPMKSSRARRAPAAPAMEMAMGDMASGAGPGGGGAGEAAPISIRKDFSALAVFEPSTTTDRSGTAVISFKLPDSLTRYRVIAVAAHGDNHFGVGESTLTARKALMVRPSAPRFLNYGDRFELPVVLENQTASPITARVVMRGHNVHVEKAGYEVAVPQRNRVEVRFPASSDRPGRARFQMAAASGAFADAAEVDIPVWTPATTEAFATYGEIDDGAIAQPIVAPKNVAKSFGGLEITTASTQLQALTDAYIYILDYPYGCAEQVSSRVVSTAALRDVLKAFDAEGMPPEAEVVAAMGRDIKRLGQLQNGDGGWGWWRRGMPSRPFLTVHVTHALARARDKGFEVPKSVLDRGHRYLKDIDRHLERRWGKGVRTSIVAYALYVRAMMGDIDEARARKLIRDSGGVAKLPLEAAGWLYPVVTDGGSLRAELASMRRLFDNRATETAATAHFATSYADGAHVILHSSRRVDALILEGMMRDQPKSPLIPKLVRGLLAHRVKGRWGNTQENAWVLLALDRYFRQYEKLTPNFVARVWLGDGFAGEKQFKGRTTDQHLIQIPMSVVTEEEKRDLLLAKDGPGRLYYRIGLRYAPSNLELEPANFGFDVKRTYEGIDDPKDVRRDDNGVWHFRAGARIRSTVTMVNTGRRYHVALIDPLPAGVEPLNAALAGSDAAPGAVADTGYYWWRRSWYEHDNLRDERAEAFTSLLWSGEHRYSYSARATTPGQFVVPPAKAEEMYFPETFGRSATDRVVVE